MRIAGTDPRYGAHFRPITARRSRPPCDSTKTCFQAILISQNQKNSISIPSQKQHILRSPTKWPYEDYTALNSRIIFENAKDHIPEKQLK